MTLTITINLDNAAFNHPSHTVTGQYDIVNAVMCMLRQQLPRKLQEQLQRAPCLCSAPEAADVLYDINGIRCGTITLTK